MMYIFTYTVEIVLTLLAHLVMRLYLELDRLGYKSKKLGSLTFLSGQSDTNAHTMMWIRNLYTLAPEEYRFDPRENFWGFKIMKPSYLWLYNQVKRFGLAILPVPLRSIYASYYARANKSIKFIDKYLSEGYNQIIILGSGLDTTAFRYYDVENIKFYEIDFPEIMENKRNLFLNIINGYIEEIVSGKINKYYVLSELIDFKNELEGKKDNKYKKINYLGCDFNGESLKNLLLTKTDVSKKTLILFEGVTYYLKPKSVIRTLLTLKECYKDFKIFFDYIESEPTNSKFWDLSSKILKANKTDFVTYISNCEGLLDHLEYNKISIHNRNKTLNKLKKHPYFKPLFYGYPNKITALIDLVCVEAEPNSQNEQLHMCSSTILENRFVNNKILVIK